MREKYAKEWLPSVLLTGMTADEFWNSDYHTIQAYEKSYKATQKQIDEHNYNLGIYFYSAISLALDQAFNGKKAQSEYIKQPMLANILEAKKVEKQLTEEDIQKMREEKVLRRKINKVNYDAWVRSKGNR